MGTGPLFHAIALIASSQNGKAIVQNPSNNGIAKKLQRKKRNYFHSHQFFVCPFCATIHRSVRVRYAYRIPPPPLPHTLVDRQEVEGGFDRQHGVSPRVRRTLHCSTFSKKSFKRAKGSRGL